VCTGTMVQYQRTFQLRRTGVEWPGQGGRCGEFVRVHRYKLSKQSGQKDAAGVYAYTGTL